MDYLTYPTLHHAGGIWDTKHLFQQLPESFPRVMSTSLGPLHEALLEGGLTAEVGWASSMHAALSAVFRLKCSASSTDGAWPGDGVPEGA